MGSFLERSMGLAQPASRRLSGQRNRIASVASHDARHPFPLEVLGARLYPAARPRLAFHIIPTPLIQSPSLWRRAAMLAIPAAKAPRMAAPASLVIVPTPVLGSIVTTTTLPGGVLLGAGAGTGTGTGTDTGLPGTGERRRLAADWNRSGDRVPDADGVAGITTRVDVADRDGAAVGRRVRDAAITGAAGDRPAIAGAAAGGGEIAISAEASAMAVPPSALTEMIVSLITSPPSMNTPPTALPQAS